MYSFPEYWEIRKKYFGECYTEAARSYARYKEHHHRKKKEKMAGFNLNLNALPSPCSAADCIECGYSLAPCTEAPKTGFKFGFKKQEEENLMNYASASVTATPATTEVQDQRRYLADRLDTVYRDKRRPLEAAFGLIDDDQPETLKDLKERIEAGKFTFRDEAKVRPYHHWTEMLVWRDPAKKADQDGFEAAKADLKAKRQAALDTIKIDEPKAGLEAIKTLEAWEPTGAAN